MELKLALICDSATVSPEGKLNILGEFNTISSREEPIRWPMLTLVARFEALTVEGTEHRLAVDLTDADGNSIVPQRLEGSLLFTPGGPGRPLRGNFMAQMQGIQFPTFGTYEFHLFIDGHRMGSVQIYIVEREEPA